MQQNGPTSFHQATWNMPRQILPKGGGWGGGASSTQGFPNPRGSLDPKSKDLENHVRPATEASLAGGRGREHLDRPRVGPCGGHLIEGALKASSISIPSNRRCIKSTVIFATSNAIEGATPTTLETSTVDPVVPRYLVCNALRIVSSRSNFTTPLRVCSSPCGGSGNKHITQSWQGSSGARF